jgi:four helix bundle protein
MKENVLKEKSFQFAVEIVKISKKIMNENKEFVLSRQLLRSGTAIGALYREAEQAESIADFIHKMAIAQKECNETIYWLDLLFTTEYVDQIYFDKLKDEATQLLKIITRIIKTSKTKIGKINH